MRNIWIAFVLVIVLVLGGVFWAASRSTQAPSGTLAADAVTPLDWVKGNKDAKVTLVEFSDFQCPACGAYFPLVQEIVKTYGDKIKFIYKHYPLPQHKNALAAAYAAEAAGVQGKFFEMHDKIFDQQVEWSEKSESAAQEIFEFYASSLGLKIDQFKQDMASSTIKAKVEKDRVAGNQSGVQGTPTFFLNGVKLQNPQSFEAFKAVIEKAINENQ